MIPIKKLKTQIVEQFNESFSERYEAAARSADTGACGRFVKFPFAVSGANGFAEARWNVKLEKFDIIDFNAFGRTHRVKL